MDRLPPFLSQLAKRQHLFAVLCAVGCLIGLCFILYALFSDTPNRSTTWVVAILILLNARMNMRMYRIARWLNTDYK